MPVPGPASRRLLDKQEEHESRARSYPRRLPIGIERAQGSFVEDVDGNVFIDFLSGAGALTLGHGHPELVEVARRQLGVHSHGLDFPTPIKDEFTRQQLRMLPAPLRDRMKVHYCGPTGANAVDAAVKLCKTATGRGEIVSFQGAFHGASHLSMALSGAVDQKSPIANGVPGVHFFPYSYCSRCPLGLHRSSCRTNCAVYLERALADSHGGVPLPAAVVLELVQGEGGVVPADPDFVARVRAVTRELDVPLIVDEVQTGCGRTGTWFAFEQYDIEPDVIVASKGLSGMGLPVATILYDERLDAWSPGAHTGTFRGNQVAFATGVAAMHIIERDHVLANVRARGEQLRQRLLALQHRHSFVRDARGRGLMWGLELADPDSGAPAGPLASAVQKAAVERGLILEVGGRQDSVVRLLPPLNVTDRVVDAACDILDRAFAVAAAMPAPGAGGVLSIVAQERERPPASPDLVVIPSAP